MKRPLIAILLSFVTVSLTAISPAQAQTNYPLNVQHEAGDTRIESRPERTVVLEYSFADHLGTLGVAPVGYAVDDMPEYLTPYTEGAGAEPVGTRKAPNLEAITALDPDLIIADLNRHEDLYDALSAIAPTVVFNSLRGSYEDQLEQFKKVAEVMDKEAEAEAVLEDYEARFESVQAQTEGDLGAFVSGMLWSGGFTAHSDRSFIGSFLERLGRDNALEVRGGETQYLLDLEGLASVNPGSLIVLCNADEQTLLDDWQANALWNAFGAVQSDHVYVFDRDLWSKGRGVMAFRRILENAEASGLLTETPSRAVSCP